MKIAVSEARDHRADLIRRALAGEEVVSTDDRGCLLLDGGNEFAETDVVSGP